VRDFLGFPGATAEANGLADELAKGVLGRTLNDETLDQMLDARRLAFVEATGTGGVLRRRRGGHCGSDHEAQHGGRGDQAEGQGEIAVVDGRSADHPRDTDRAHADHHPPNDTSSTHRP
jgi:hypothetical protein